ncbi:MAG TPA: fused MFS/spermidine synthase [Vicinamibacterales bacterium]|nr:fused MFS/spermidine synthase [Vicinamibacterales bacterium]
MAAIGSTQSGKPAVMLARTIAKPPIGASFATPAGGRGAGRRTGQPRDESVIASTKSLDSAPSRALVPLFAATLFFSSLQMFAVEPIVAKTVLPILGGTPMVWNTCVLFFQILLLGGYAYAHATTRWLSRRACRISYALLLALPLAVLPFGIGAGAQPPAGGSPVGWLLLVLLRSIGLPFFALAATAPMLQRWFADTDHPSARDPYFLYAASNVGSLLALIAYPTLIEPALPLREQNAYWTMAYGIFVTTAAFSLIAARRCRTGAADTVAAPAEGDRAQDDSRITWEQRATWTALAFVPSSLMLAVTTYFSTDIAPVPLFWIAPLALYLLTFVVAFSTRSAAARSFSDRFIPLLVLPLVILMVAGAGFSLWGAIPLHLAAFTMAALVCHGRLAAGRPAAAHLTEYYFWIAFGGMLGGVFNTLAAPVLFSRVIEYPLVLVLALAARRGRVATAAAPWSMNDLAMPIGVGAISAAFIVWLHPGGADGAQLFVAGLGLPAFVAFTQSRAPRRFAACVATMLVAGSTAASAYGGALYTSRTFFGVYRVTSDARFRSLYHGSTVHGMQWLDTSRTGEPLTYYGAAGPVGQAFASLPAAASRRDVAVVGLGVGTLASYRLPGQQWTFYEIDPEVERIARTNDYFSYLRTCGEGCRVVLGDARLSMARAPDHAYGLIVLDAFSSDAIPLHLVTREALALYLGKLSPGGALAFHITNRHLMLEPVIARLADSMGLSARWQQHRADPVLRPGEFSSEWIVMARRPQDLGSVIGDPRWNIPPIPPGTPLWTDDFSNIVSVLSLTPR